MPGPSQIFCPFFPTGFWGLFFSGYPGTLTCSFRFNYLCCSYVHFLTIIKVGYGLIQYSPVCVGYFRFLFFYLRLVCSEGKGC